MKKEIPSVNSRRLTDSLETRRSVGDASREVYVDFEDERS